MFASLQSESLCENGSFLFRLKGFGVVYMVALNVSIYICGQESLQGH